MGRGRAAGALHDGVPRAARCLGAARPPRPAHAGDRSVREPPAARVEGHVPLRLGLFRSRRAAALVAAFARRQSARRAPRPRPAGDGGLRPPDGARAARAARQAHRGAGPRRDRRRRAARARALRPRLADVQRGAPRRPSVLGSLAARGAAGWAARASCSSARSRTSTRRSTRPSAASSPRCPATPTSSSPPRSGWTSTARAPTCCRRCSRRCCRADRCPTTRAARARSGGCAPPFRRARAARSRRRCRIARRSSSRRAWSCAGSTGRRRSVLPSRRQPGLHPPQPARARARGDRRSRRGGRVAALDRRGLATFRDPDGVPPSRASTRVSEHHSGARADQLPDLVLQWSPRAATTLTGVHSPSFGDVLRRGSGSGRSGNHPAGMAGPSRSPARTPPLR